MKKMERIMMKLRKLEIADPGQEVVAMEYDGQEIYDSKEVVEDITDNEIEVMEHEGVEQDECICSVRCEGVHAERTQCGLGVGNVERNAKDILKTGGIGGAVPGGEKELFSQNVQARARTPIKFLRSTIVFQLFQAFGASILAGKYKENGN